MFRTLFVVSFMVLALIAPVWIPVPIAKVLANRPAPTRKKDAPD